MSDQTMKLIGRPELAQAFTEWERRHREQPEQFATEMQKLAETCETYGQQAAEYLAKLLEESVRLDVPPRGQSALECGRYVDHKSGAHFK